MGLRDSPETTQIVRVVLPWYVAGAEVDPSGHITRAAPIIGWAVGKKLDSLIEWVVHRNGGAVEELTDPSPGQSSPRLTHDPAHEPRTEPLSQRPARTGTTLASPRKPRTRRARMGPRLV